jgi:16S rRNA processing protein RimM
MSPSREYDLVVGEVGRAHGVRGEVRVWPLTDHPERLAEIDRVHLELSSGEGRLLRLERVRRHRGAMLVQFAEVRTRAGAEQLRGAMVCVRQSDAVPLAEGEYFWHDILGLTVVTTAGENLGPVTDVLRTGANDVYVTERALIPAIPEVVVAVDCDSGRLIIEPMPGLLE